MTAPEEYLWWINLKYSETTMKYNWGVEGSYSPYRKWCSGKLIDYNDHFQRRWDSCKSGGAKGAKNGLNFASKL